MKLLKFEIEDYKSIKKSGMCRLATDITLLAGKNESGKSACLEALRDYDVSIEEIPQSAHSIDDDQTEPRINLWWTLTKEELQEILDELEVTLADELQEKMLEEGVLLIKDHEGSYYLGDDLKKTLNEVDRDSYVEKLKEANASIGTIKPLHEKFSKIKPIQAQAGISDIRKTLKTVEAVITEVLTVLTDEAVKQQVNDALTIIAAINKDLPINRTGDKIAEELQERLPKFVFYSSFDDKNLPHEIPLEEAKNNSAIKDFAKIAGLDLDKVISTTAIQKRTNLLAQRSAHITGQFREFWHQDELELIAAVTDGKLILHVKETGKTTQFAPDQRSKGFQWFLSFYLRLQAQGSLDEPSIILIDEPGLYLHAKAQTDVLQVLESLAEESQILISTHSPYLIDSDRLDRVRLVQRGDDGTKVENKVHKNASEETLTPIVTSIGLDVSRSLSLVKEHNLILEGITDYFYLMAFRKLFKRQNADYALIPSVGASKVPTIASMLMGWGLNFAALLDHDHAGREAEKLLKNKLSINPKKIVMVASDKDADIEDLFSVDDFKKYLLADLSADVKDSNSKHLKTNSYDKQVLAKTFYELVLKKPSDVKFSAETKAAINALLDAIDLALQDQELFAISQK